MAIQGGGGETEMAQKVGLHDSEVPAEDGRPSWGNSVVVSKKTSHRVGVDEWYTVGFHIVAALNNAFALGYPAQIMANLGWTAGVLCIVGAIPISFYNNCLLGDLHETGGKRHVRYRDLAGHIYGRHMYNATWFVQYTFLCIGIIGALILAGESLKAIATAIEVGAEVTLPGWVGVAGAVLCIFAFLVPTLHSLRFISTCSLLLSCTFTFIGIGVSLRDGLKASGPRDYSVKGSDTSKAFKALGAVSTIAFAFNTGILPEMQATVKEPSVRNIKKALGLQFTAGAFPILMVTFVGYWAYGNSVAPYLLSSATVSGPKSALTVANAAAFLQSMVSIHIFASPIYEFMDTHFETKGSHEWSRHSMVVRLITRTTFIALNTFLGALLPFSGDFVALTAPLVMFPLEGGLAHHMYLKVKGENFGMTRLIWHWGIIIISVAVTLGTFAAGLRFIIMDSINYHAFANI